MKTISDYIPVSNNFGTDLGTKMNEIMYEDYYLEYIIVAGLVFLFKLNIIFVTNKINSLAKLSK